MYRAANDAVLVRASFKDDGENYDVTNQEYHGFVFFKEWKCGQDFMKALFDGRVRVNIFDYGADYAIQYSYDTKDKWDESMAVFQYWRQVISHTSFQH